MGKPNAKYKVGDIVRITPAPWHPYANHDARIEGVEWTMHNNYHYKITILRYQGVAQGPETWAPEYLFEGVVVGKTVRRVQ